MTDYFIANNERNISVAFWPSTKILEYYIRAYSMYNSSIQSFFVYSEAKS